MYESNPRFDYIRTETNYTTNNPQHFGSLWLIKKDKIMDLKETIKGKLEEWKSDIESLQLTLHLGKADASDEFEKQKQNLSKWLTEAKEKLVEIKDEKATDLKTKIEELELQAALGKAEGEDELKKQQKNIHDGELKAQHVFDQSVFLTSVTLIVVTIFVCFFAWSFTRSIIKPMQNVLHLAQSIAQGDLTQIIHDEGNDETAKMIVAFNQMQQTLRDTIHKIQDSIKI